MVSIFESRPVHKGDLSFAVIYCTLVLYSCTGTGIIQSVPNVPNVPNDDLMTTLPLGHLIDVPYQVGAALFYTTVLFGYICLLTVVTLLAHNTPDWTLGILRWEPHTEMITRTWDPVTDSVLFGISQVDTGIPTFSASTIIGSHASHRTKAVDVSASDTIYHDWNTLRLFLTFLVTV